MKLSALYQHHKQFYIAKEQSRNDRAWDYYNGHFYALSDRDRRYRDDEDIGSHALSSKNIVYAIADTALSLLIGNSLGVAMNPRNRFAQEKRTEVEAYLDYVFQQNRLRRRATAALLDAILYGRGIFKTRWDKKADIAKVKVIHPSRVFFDMEARDVEDISYWLETTVISTKEWHRRVEQGRYEGEKIGDVEGEEYPDWLDRNDQDYTDLRKAFRWVVVVEYHDVAAGTVAHWVPQIDEIVFKDKVPFAPYSLFYLSPNGRDCRGLSEVQLILDDQEATNAMKSLLNEIAYLSIPKIAFDDSKLDVNQAQAIADAPLGSWSPIGRGQNATPGAGAPMRMEDLFARIPTPETPAAVVQASEMAQADAAYVTAFADQSRGQVRNVRTATEMAFVDAQLQTRTSNRRAMFFEAVEDVAAKSLAYAKKYMRQPIEVMTAENGGWVCIDRWLSEVEAQWQTLAYNPLRDNPAVLGERIMQIMPLIMQSPFYNQRAVHEFLLDSMHLPSRLLIPKDSLAIDPLTGQPPVDPAAAAAPVAPAAPTAPVDPMAQPPVDPTAIDPALAGQLVQMGAEMGPEGVAALAEEEAAMSPDVAMT